MEIKDEKVITELKVARSYLKEINTDNLNFDEHINIVKCETVLDVLLSLLEEPLFIAQKISLKEEDLCGDKFKRIQL